jgi:hypothetical protein
MRMNSLTTGEILAEADAPFQGYDGNGTVYRARSMVSGKVFLVADVIPAPADEFILTAAGPEPNWSHNVYQFVVSAGLVAAEIKAHCENLAALAGMLAAQSSQPDKGDAELNMAFEESLHRYAQTYAALADEGRGNPHGQGTEI